MKEKTAVIADDEQNLIVYLRSRLASLWPELKIVGEARNGREALALVKEFTPDIVFLDIKMPGMSGIEVASKLTNQCHVVFVTAYDDYAIAAFEQQAVDYLLKPVEDSRLQKTIDRICTETAREIDAAGIVTLLENLRQGEVEYLNWIRIGLRGETKIIDVAEVAYFKADQKYVSVRTKGAEYLIRRSIKALETELDPNHFWRIHRGTLVNVRFIESAKKDFRGRYTLSLKNIRQTLKVSDSYGHRFRQM